MTIAASVTLALNEMNKFSFGYSSGLQQLEYVRFWRKESGRELVLISHEVSAGITFPTYNSAFSITHLSLVLSCRLTLCSEKNTPSIQVLNSLVLPWYLKLTFDCWTIK